MEMCLNFPCSYEMISRTEFNVCDVKIKTDDLTFELPVCVMGFECHSFPYTLQTTYTWNVIIYMFIH